MIVFTYMSTIQQVALLAKVSVATVSRVINQSAHVSEGTRLRVDAAIKKLNYQPNAMGALLRKERTNMVLVLVHSVDNPFFSMIVQGIERHAHENAYNVLICTTYGDKQREQHYIKMLKNHFVDGVLLISNTLTLNEMNELNQLYPVVQIIEYIDGSNTPYYSVDYYAASVELMEQLISAGKKCIAFIHAGSTHIVSNLEKYRGYHDTLLRHGLPVVTPLIGEEYPFGFISGKALTTLALDTLPEIDAFFVTSDLPAMGVIDELKHRQLDIPNDVAVVGFDNTLFSTLSSPQITTVELNTFDLGINAMKRLLKRINKADDEDETHIKLPYHIVKRESS
jgi:DNA-binding LacI/PurR family transcriptional regulator